MKILHISTSDSGGAGIAAIRTHIALLEAGIDSKLLCLYKTSTSTPEVYQFHKSNNNSIKKQLLNRFGLKLPNSVLNKRLVQGRSGDFEIFSFPKTDIELHKHHLVKNADLIQLHWVADFLDYPSFFVNVKKPIVWTLHDMNPFQGGFHYLKDRVSNLELWGDIDGKIIEIKEECISKVSNLHIVTPSKWLGVAAKESSVFKGRPVHYNFYNGINFEIYKPIKQEIACEVLGIPAEGLKVLFVAETIANKRKGFDLLLAALNSLKNRQGLTLVTIGQISNKDIFKDFQCFHLGTIKDERLINIAYNVADCFVIPSREDNFPNVMLEALACGLPIISFPVGGMAEVIETGENGVLTDSITSQSLAESLEDFINNKYSFRKERIREKAMQMFNKKQHADKYISLYQKMLF